MIPTYNKGSCPLIEAEFETYTAFDDYAHFDPATSSITIYQPGDTPKFDAVALTKSELGKWFYKCQTAADWPVGDWHAKVAASDGVNSDVKDAVVFSLK